MIQTNSEKKIIISVIVPVYNQERYVKKCLNSILKQGITNMEVIVVNDGSTDDSLAIIQDIAAQDSRIVVINKTNEGVSFARRDGLKAAKGEYITFVDSDDYLPPHALKTLYDIILREGVDVVAGQFIRRIGLFNRKGRCPNEITERKIMLPELWDKYYISYMGVNILPVQMCGKLYKKAVIDKAMSEVSLFSDTIRTMGEDEYFNLMLHPYINSMYVSNKHIYVYRYGGGTSKYNPHLTELYELSDIRLQLLDKYHYSQGYDTLFIEYKNYIYSEICQRIIYKHEIEEQLISFLIKELNNRYTYRRMTVHFQNKETCMEIKMLLDKNYLAIISCAQQRLVRSKWRRRTISFAQSIFNIK